MLVVDMLLRRYPGYTVSTLLDEDPWTVEMLLDIALACAGSADPED